jgi:putative restriction endonuclease
VRFYVAITDSDWFSFLSQSAPLDEVNFWQPSAGRRFRALEPGGPFLFKLHSPKNYIVGGGFFRYFTTLPVSFAWRAFTTKNGAQSEQEMRARIGRYRRLSPPSAEDYEIGCILLQSPFFFREEDWIPASDWDPNIVQGRGYETEELRGQWIWEQVQEWLAAHETAAGLPLGRVEEEPKFGEPQIVLPRLGQGSFRVVVADAYNRLCAFTRSPVLHVLDAAHIKPFAQEGPNDVQNGMLLRQDVHTLFDRGYITVTPEYRVEVSRRIKDEFENGQEYYLRHGTQIALPENAELKPGNSFLNWHNENVYLG